MTCRLCGRPEEWDVAEGGCCCAVLAEAFVSPAALCPHGQPRYGFCTGCIAES